MKYKVTQSEPYFGIDEIENLKKVIESEWVTEGPFSKLFLEKIKEITSSKYAVLANNGTLALYLALKSINLEPGDEVILPDFTFNASASAIVFAGGIPVFVDINKSDLQIDPKIIESKITKRTKAIMPVHVYGQSCDMDAIIQIAKKYSLRIVEDAAQGFGVFYKNRHTGTIGDVGIISFFADKTITTGEGAVILTQDKKVYEKLLLLRNQGRPNSGTFIHPSLGMNFRMTDLQSAVGVAQINKFDKIKEIKLKNYHVYKKYLSDIEQVTLIKVNEYSNFIPFRFNVRVQNLDQLITYLEANKIQTRKFFYPLHLQPCYNYLKFPIESCPNSVDAFQTGLSLPVHCKLTEDDISFISNTIAEFYN